MWSIAHTESFLRSVAWQREREWVRRQPLAVAEGYLRALRCFDPAPPDAWPREVEVLVTLKAAQSRPSPPAACDRMLHHRAG
jgi:hypothetical protein